MSVTLALVLAIAAAPPQRSIAILDVKPAVEADRQIAELLTTSLAESVAKVSKARVISAVDVRALLDTAAAQALLGCDDERCLGAQLKSVLAVDEIVVGRAGMVDGQVLLFLSLLDVKAASVTARASTSFARGASLPVAADAAAALLTSTAASSAGDQTLSELRVALVFDEASAPDGPSAKLRPVEACVGEQLLAAGTSLVSAEQVANLKGQGGAKALLAGETPAFLTSSEVDAVLAARVEYSEGGTFARAVSADADMALRLVQVDSGTILVAKQLRAVGNGFTANAARKEAARKLCADVRPVVAAALGERRARGHRVVVDVAGRGALTPDALAAALGKLKNVARVRVARFDERGATLELVVMGGDGVSLALDVMAAAPRVPVRVVSAEASALKVAW